MRKLHTSFFALACSITFTSCVSQSDQEQNNETKTTQKKGVLSPGKVIEFDYVIKRTPQSSQTHLQRFQEIVNTHKNVVVDFYADWCGPCKRLAPVMKSVAPTRTDTLFIKVNTDSYPTLAKKYSIRSIPTILYFSQGKLVKRTTGFMSEQEMKKIIASIY